MFLKPIPVKLYPRRHLLLFQRLAYLWKWPQIGKNLLPHPHTPPSSTHMNAALYSVPISPCTTVYTHHSDLKYRHDNSTAPSSPSYLPFHICHGVPKVDLIHQCSYYPYFRTKCSPSNTAHIRHSVLKYSSFSSITVLHNRSQYPSTPIYTTTHSNHIPLPPPH